MALIACPECGKQVSSQAASCPHCGIGLAGARPGLAPPLAPAAPPGPEQVLWEAGPSQTLLLGQALLLGLVVAAVIVLVAVVFPALLGALGDLGQRTWVDPSKGPLLLAAVLGAYVLVRGIRIGLLAARLRTTRYRLTNQRLTVESGLVSRSMVEVDLRSVEDLVYHQGPVERLLGIGTIAVVSSDRTAPRLRLQGVKDPRGTRELIRTHAYAATQRQLFTRST
ncbi:MAG TPA: PH domain-containing protein [Myxococcaceae bacterium]|jgi:membrane protein YdbS with pleckstrin-like domain|nr:PH domain-containing protein [Myxococcaceae bacterium]